MANVLEVNSFDTLTESLNLIDKMSVFVENAMNEVETLNILLEAADENPENQTADDKERFGKLKMIKEKVVQAALYIWEQLGKVINWLKAQFNIVVRGKTPIVLQKDVEVSKYCFESFPSELDSIVNNYINGSNYKDDGTVKKTAEAANTIISKCASEKVTKKAKEKIEAIPIIKKLNSIENTRIKVQNKIKSFKNDLNKQGTENSIQRIIGVMSNLGRLYKNICSDCKSLLHYTKGHNPYYDNENVQKKYNERNINKAVKNGQKNGGDEDMTNTESITIPDGMSKREYAARLMLEAAHIMLAEDEQAQNEAVVSNERVNAKREALTEAVNLLYEKATLTESAEEAAMYVEKAEEIQKEIDELPEEKPAEMDEYPADDVTGGAGAGDEDKQEAIKDLCDNDKQVMDLLLDDENKSVTVDPDGNSSAESTPQNESAGLFNLDF